ncbi:MAG TPA: MBL fold metallo-hydrolase [Thermotogota bacterium]|nr:MBL fold metallo-hydrolase [Thermotogota bacterium]HPJ87854.1 MBL fold metallo-hydrolase [Thermotogota bacterium]HPR94947.1 MBL fold metallo-hydrolase [Thermotogota bacterium]
MEQKFIKLTENFYYLEQEDERDRPVLGYFKGQTASVMIDGGTSIRHMNEFLGHLKENHLNYPDYCILTHFHYDHIFGLSELFCPVISLEGTKQQMRTLVGRDLEETIKAEGYAINNEFAEGIFDIGIKLPEITFERKLTMDTGSDTLTFEKVISDHTDDCCVMFSPTEKVLFIGDCLYIGTDDDKVFYYHKDIYLPLLKKLLNFKADYYIDSHRGVFKHEEMERMLTEFDELITLTEKYDSVEILKANISDSLKKSMSEEALEWYYTAFRNGMKV